MPTPLLETGLANSSSPNAQTPGECSIAFQRVVNFRDLGGVSTSLGRVRRGRVFRSASLQFASASDAAKLDMLGIGTVIDLRTEQERNDHGYSSDWQPRRSVHAPLVHTLWDRNEVGADDNPAAFLTAQYLKMLERGDVAHAVAAVADAASDGLHPGVLFHCAGKDRTGVLAAVVLSLLGADDASIVADYHHTANSMPALVALFSANSANQSAMVNQPAAFLESPPKAMENMLEIVRFDWGSMEQYALEHGVTTATINLLRISLLDC